MHCIKRDCEKKNNNLVFIKYSNNVEKSRNIFNEEEQVSHTQPQYISIYTLDS